MIDDGSRNARKRPKHIIMEKMRPPDVAEWRKKKREVMRNSCSNENEGVVCYIEAEAYISQLCAKFVSQAHYQPFVGNKIQC